MENKVNDLLQLIKKSFPDVQFEIIHNSLSPSLKHFIIKDAKEKGFGSDHDLTIAIEKAYSEFVERKVFRELNKAFKGFETSNGFSAHKYINRSAENSTNEIIERDAFLISWTCQKAPYWIDRNEFSSLLKIENREILNQHTKNKLEINLGLIARTNNVITAVIKINDINKRHSYFYIDTKAGFDLAGLANDLTEGISFYSHFFLKSDKKLSAKKKLNEPIDHFFYYLKEHKGTEWFHKGASNVLDLEMKNIKTYTINPNDILDTQRKVNRVVCFAESNCFQDYYCGKFSQKKINIDRIIETFGKEYPLNKQVHPLS